MCEFDEYVVLNIDQQFEVSLHEPVLLERDIYLLMDALPTTRTMTSERGVASYVFEQVQMDQGGQETTTGMEVEISFGFVQSDGELRLSKITSSEIPSEILASAAILVAGSATMAQQACDISINPFKRSAMIEIDQEMLKVIPDRSTALALLGPPSDSAGNDENLVYDFRLKGDQEDLPMVRIDASYDAASDRLETVKTSFTRYDAMIDVPEGTIRLTLNR